MTPNYAKLDEQRRRHYKRYVRFIEAMPKKLSCQECHGYGGETEVVLDDGTGPYYECGWCEGTGFVTPHVRGQWLKYKKEERNARSR